MNIRFDRKTALVLSGIAVVVIVFLLLTVSLLNKVRKAGKEAKALEREMLSVRQALQLQENFRQNGKLLSRRQISLAIDDITKVGAAQNVNFLSISPQKITRPSDSSYQVLPIQMNVQSAYVDLGLFLNALERLEQGIIAVKGFEITRDQLILPQIKSGLVVEVYLKEGDGG